MERWYDTVIIMMLRARWEGGGALNPRPPNARSANRHEKNRYFGGFREREKHRDLTRIWREKNNLKMKIFALELIITKKAETASGGNVRSFFWYSAKRIWTKTFWVCRDSQGSRDRPEEVVASVYYGGGADRSGANETLRF